MGNFVTDLMRLYYNSDFAFVNAGVFRINKLIPRGPLSLLEWHQCFPIETTIVVLKIPGDILLKVMEHAVSRYPSCEGRFLAISNLKVTYNPKSKQIESLWDVNKNEEIDEDKEYKVSTTAYLLHGGDGYSILQENNRIETLIDEENGIYIIEMIKKFFSKTST